LTRRPSAFISHSSRDLPFVRRLAERLRGQGIEVWLDDMQLKVGDTLTETIALALKQHDFVVVVFSRASLASAWVRKEVAMAARHSSRSRVAKIVPLLLERRAAGKLPTNLRDTKYVDFSDPRRFEEGLAQLVDLMIRDSPAAARRRSLERIEFIGGESVSAALRTNIVRMFEDYQVYIRRLGFRSKFGAFDVAFASDESMISSYDPQYDRIITNAAYAGEEDYLRRDYTHHALFTTRPDLSGRLGADWTLAAIESGLAAYFPCSFKGHPLFGDSAARIAGQTTPLFDLTNVRRFAEVKNDAESVATDGLEVWGGLFWQLRAQLGALKTDALLWRAWTELNIRARRSDDEFLCALVRLDSALHATKHAAAIRDIFVERGVRAAKVKMRAVRIGKGSGCHD
jgi:TIR domain